jgi:putative FmdB family regulatory protein
MPLYDFRCHSCGHQFEALARPNHAPSCPDCNGTDLERLMSTTFAVSSEATRRSHFAAAKKKNAKQLRDKERAERAAALKHHH